MSDGMTAAMRAAHRKMQRVPIAIEPARWHLDHLSTLLYVESRIVDQGGTLKIENMRCNKRRHPFFAHAGSDMGFVGTRTWRDGPEIVAGQHDDWDCVADFERESILENDGTGIYPRYRLTPLGWRLCWWLRYLRGEHYTRDVQCELLRFVMSIKGDRFDFNVFAWADGKPRGQR